MRCRPETWRHALNVRVLHVRESRTDVFDKKDGNRQTRDINREVGRMADDL